MIDISGIPLVAAQIEAGIQANKMKQSSKRGQERSRPRLPVRRTVSEARQLTSKAGRTARPRSGNRRLSMKGEL